MNECQQHTGAIQSKNHSKISPTAITATSPGKFIFQNISSATPAAPDLLVAAEELGEADFVAEAAVADEAVADEFTAIPHSSANSMTPSPFTASNPSTQVPQALMAGPPAGAKDAQAQAVLLHSRLWI